MGWDWLRIAVWIWPCKFQSTHPAWGGTMITAGFAGYIKFQSTLSLIHISSLKSPGLLLGGSTGFWDDSRVIQRGYLWDAGHRKQLSLADRLEIRVLSSRRGYQMIKAVNQTLLWNKKLLFQYIWNFIWQHCSNGNCLGRQVRVFQESKFEYCLSLIHI